MRPINWVVVGIGDVARQRVLPAIAADPLSRLHGVVTRKHQGSVGLNCHTWRELDEALLDARIDAVYIASPVFLHAPQSIAALEAGKHVLCEKPAALDYASALKMTEVARRKGRQLAIAYFRRQYPKILCAKALVEQGVIGKPLSAYAACSEFFDGDPTRTWLIDPDLAGGGPLFDIGSHRIDALNFILGAPTAVSSHFIRRPGLAVETAAIATIDYTSGCRAMVEARWDTKAVLDDFRIVGTDGELQLGPLNGPLITHPGGHEELPCCANRHEPCIRAFTAALLSGQPCAHAADACLGAAFVLNAARTQAIP